MSTVLLNLFLKFNDISIADQIKHRSQICLFSEYKCLLGTWLVLCYGLYLITYII
jgi:hypothetical protein